MQIEISQEQFERLAARALAAGFASVPALLEALAAEPACDPRGSLSPEQLQASVTRLREADAAVSRGEGSEVRAALHSIASKFGLDLPA